MAQKERRCKDRSRRRKSKRRRNEANRRSRRIECGVCRSGSKDLGAEKGRTGGDTGAAYKEGREEKECELRGRGKKKESE